MGKNGKPRLSYETSFRIKVGLLAVIFGIAIFMTVYYPLISHEVDPFRVSSPKGQILLAKNFSMMGVNYTNVVPFTAENNALVLGGKDEMEDTLTIKISTPGWCADLWIWGGSSSGWTRKYECLREFPLSKYAFNRVPTREAKEIVSWNLEKGYIIVFHKNSPVQNYELVNFTVTYGERTDWGAFKVAVKSS
ncbi:hypothetical protein [Thermococcus pacificus]|uniref:Uncharacterized protein n=1 Tax=Thermococcus pacificus TaxID=71998 RepID=A0A218P6C1_9EURY|nr:hypothetical protein [Thermococcus pacificus]ASJ06281.1 hypothetical protein A3L08_02515 [Thermococcus pacificus]